MLRCNGEPTTLQPDDVILWLPRNQYICIRRGEGPEAVDLTFGYDASMKLRVPFIQSERDFGTFVLTLQNICGLEETELQRVDGLGRAENVALKIASVKARVA